MKVVRISHLGYYDDLDVITVLAAVEWVLKDLGHNFQLGSGVSAAMKALHDG